MFSREVLKGGALPALKWQRNRERNAFNVPSFRTLNRHKRHSKQDTSQTRAGYTHTGHPTLIEPRRCSHKLVLCLSVRRDAFSAARCGRLMKSNSLLMLHVKSLKGKRRTAVSLVPQYVERFFIDSAGVSSNLISRKSAFSGLGTLCVF